MSLESFLDQVAMAAASRGNNLSSLLSINPKTNKIIPQLQPLLQNSSDKTISNLIDSKNFFDGNWPAFESLLLSFLLFVRDFNPWSILESIDLMIKFFSDLSIASGNTTYSKAILPLLDETISLVVPLSRMVDVKLMKVNNRIDDFPRLSFVSSILLKSLNGVRSDPDLNTSNNRYKISILMTLSIELCRTYFFIKSPMLCNNVFSNVNILALNTQFIKKKHLIQYRYLCGKFHILQSNYIDAFSHFEYCYNNIHRNCKPEMIIKILEYLIPSGLIVGKVFNLRLLYHFNETILQGRATHILEIYSRLIPPYKAGNLFDFSAIVHANEAYFLKVGILVGFLQRTRIIIFRNLLKSAHKLNQGYLSFDIVKRALDLSINLPASQKVFGTEWMYYATIDNYMSSHEFTENVVMALILNVLLKGKFSPATKKIILSNTGTFPNIFDLYTQSYPKNQKEAWLNK